MTIRRGYLGNQDSYSMEAIDFDYASSEVFLQSHGVISNSPAAPIIMSRMLWLTIGYFPGWGMIASPRPGRARSDTSKLR